MSAAALLLWSGCQPIVGTPYDGTTAGPKTGSEYFVGGVDEVIGTSGPTAAIFVDAEYRQLRQQDAITPIYDPEFTTAIATNLPANELVIGLDIQGDAKAYPAGILYNREMVNDIVGGVPVLVTWCPLCYTALVHDRRVHGSAHVFGNQGALYKGAMTWYDHETGSVWSQPTGEVIAGPLVGAGLELMPAQLTTWGKWLAANPDSRVLTPEIPSTFFSGRQPGADHVVGVLVGDHASAWPYVAVLEAGSITAAIDDTEVVVRVDGATGAIHAIAVNDHSRELPVIIAYRWAWENFYPDGQVDKGNRIQ